MKVVANSENALGSTQKYKGMRFFIACSNDSAFLK